MTTMKNTEAVKFTTQSKSIRIRSRLPRSKALANEWPRPASERRPRWN